MGWKSHKKFRKCFEYCKKNESGYTKVFRKYDGEKIISNIK